MTTEKWLFILDVDNIQGYIFDTNRLKTIIGASWLLDHLNAADDGAVFQLLETFGFGKNAREIRQNENFVYSSGGNTVLVFDAEDKAEKFARQVTRTYQEVGISVTTCTQKVIGEIDAGSYARALKLLAQKKYNKASPCVMPGSPYFKICELCGKRYAEGKLSDQKGEIICSPCEKKYLHAGEAFRNLPEFKFITDFNKLKSRNGMIALVLVDGNNMGEKISRLSRLGGDFLENLKQFSRAADEVIMESCQWLIKDMDRAGDIDGVRPLIMGGDDLCFVMDARRALEFVEKLTRSVEETSGENGNARLFNGGIKLCAGVLFMKRSYPFNFAHRIAESLLRSAKRASRKNGHCSMVDFHIIFSSAADAIETIREDEYVYGGNLYLTQKPLKISDLGSFRVDLTKLSQCLARNKIKFLRQALRSGREESTIEMLKMARKLEGKDQADFLRLVNKYGWCQTQNGQWQTGILDLVELSDLAGR